jgi:uncharacterized protein
VNTYFDTSAIMKLVVVEEGSDAASAVWDGSDVLITSRLSYAEARAALAAARRAKRLSERQLQDAKTSLEGRFQEIDVIEVTSDVVRSAGDLAERHALRGYGAVHLASALMLDAENVVLATWDREVARAAQIEGFALAGIRVD